MADYLQELLGKHVLLYVESTETADLYEKKCLFAESLSHTSDKTYDEFESRDCADPDAPAAKRRTLKSISDVFAGTGHVKSDAALKEMDDWHYTDVKRNVELRLHQPLADGTIGALVATYKGAARLQVNSRDYNPGGPIVVSASILIEGTVQRVYPA
ncbi:hypothetical protein [Hyphomonas sp.]|uniref:hypothetical protein n=1 Tax=Hyphomonas sp. TaxID=87 RepID=UPI0025BE965D|nr:hypothetical protein [Hyphomonas sp.]MBI1401456.1 hypothetical protein [Hyphomonas sp.]